MTTIFTHKNAGLTGTPAIPSRRGSPGCRYQDAPGQRNTARPRDLGPVIRKGVPS